MMLLSSPRNDRLPRSAIALKPVKVRKLRRWKIRFSQRGMSSPALPKLHNPRANV